MQQVLLLSFFMFLKQVYKYNKWLFILMALFAAGQLFINFKQGLVVTPFYNYGMYSEVLKPDSSYQVFKVEQNGRLLRGQDFSTQEWDKILLPLSFYANKSRNNNLFETDIKRILSKGNIKATPGNFLIECDCTSFVDWYAGYLSRITKEPTKSLKIYYQTYLYNGRLIPTDSVKPFSYLCL